MQYISSDIFLKENEKYLNKDFLLEIFTYLNKTKDNNSKHLFNEFFAKKGFTVFSALHVLLSLKQDYLNEYDFHHKIKPIINKNFKINPNVLKNLFIQQYKKIKHIIDNYYQIDFDSLNNVTNNTLNINQTDIIDDKITFLDNMFLIEENHEANSEIYPEGLFFLSKINYKDFLFIESQKSENDFYFENSFERVNCNIFEVRVELNNENSVIFHLLPYIVHPKYKDCFIFFSDKEMYERIKIIINIIKIKFIKNEKKSF
tara:strand:- start:9675 stop:10451 length:777 start_codon:yes stop_codon:yes gene_type:complete